MLIVKKNIFEDTTRICFDWDYGSSSNNDDNVGPGGK